TALARNPARGRSTHHLDRPRLDQSRDLSVAGHTLPTPAEGGTRDLPPADKAPRSAATTPRSTPGGCAGWHPADRSSPPSQLVSRRAGSCKREPPWTEAPSSVGLSPRPRTAFAGPERCRPMAGRRGE